MISQHDIDLLWIAIKEIEKRIDALETKRDRDTAPTFTYEYPCAEIKMPIKYEKER